MTWVPLHLTSPHMTDSMVAHGGGLPHEVTHAQKLLTHNRFKDFQPGVIDGEYGEHSAGATHRAKYWLGYRRSKVNKGFGPGLKSYLEGERLPRAFRVRRAARLAAYRLRQRKRNTVLAQRKRAHNFARGQVGYKESPFGTNRNKYGAWYRADGVPWCAIFRCYCWVVGAGYKKGISWIRGHQWAYVPYIVSAARLHQHGLEVIAASYVQQGDTVCYDWDHNGVADHTESFDEWVQRGVSFYAIGGNTGPINVSNGGEVAREFRYVSEVQAFVRVRA